MNQMTGLVAAEWSKAWKGRAWIAIGVLGVLMAVMSAVGYASEGPDAIAAGTSDPEAVTNDVVRQWFVVFLFTAIYASFLVTREYSSGSISRSILVAGRARLFLAKALTAMVLGLVWGLAVAALAIVAPYVFLPLYDVDVAWTSESTKIVAGLVACNVFAALWGVMIGWVVRHQVGAAGVVVLLMLLAEPALQRLAPEPAKYLFSISLSAIYRDVGHDLLSTAAAFAVAAVWVLAAGALALTLLRSRDVS